MYNSGVYTGRLPTHPGVYTGRLPTPHTTLCTPCIPPGYIPPYTPGYTSTLLYMDWCTQHTPGPSSAGRRSPGLRREESHGWERLSGSQDPKGVREVMPVCAELLPSSRVKEHKDWIDEGCSLLYTLRMRAYCAKRCFPSGHPIVEEHAAQTSPHSSPR